MPSYPSLDPRLGSQRSTSEVMQPRNLTAAVACSVFVWLLVSIVCFMMALSGPQSANVLAASPWLLEADQSKSVCLVVECTRSLTEGVPGRRKASHERVTLGIRTFYHVLCISYPVLLHVSRRCPYCIS